MQPAWSAGQQPAESQSAATPDVEASPRTPQEKIRRYVEAIAAAAEARPHFPPIWMREIAKQSLESEAYYVVMRMPGGVLTRNREPGATA